MTTLTRDLELKTKPEIKNEQEWEAYRCTVRGYREVHDNARQAFREAHEALTEASFHTRGDEVSLAAVERAFDRALMALNSLASWDRQP